MSGYTSTISFAELASLIEPATRILLLTHGKPDGDAMGSMLALKRALAARGKRCDMFLKGPVGWNLKPFLAPEETIHLLEHERPGAEYEIIIVTDTGARTQLDPLGDWLAARRERVVVIDHHVNGDLELAAHRIVDAKAPSATFLVAGLIDALNVPISGGGGAFSIAEALLLGLATDTGWFKFNNASPATFRLVARLLEAGADKARIFALTEENDRPERLALKARAIQSVEYVAGGAAAVMTLLPKDFAETGADSEEMTGIVNEPLSIAKVRVAALISTVDGKTTKISWRSKPGVSLPSPPGRGAGGEGAANPPSLPEGGGKGVGEGDCLPSPPGRGAGGEGTRATNHEQQTTNPILPAIDVNVLAAQFGGGGHIHAAGARVERPMEEVRREVIAGLEQACTAPSLRPSIRVVDSSTSEGI